MLDAAAIGELLIDFTLEAQDETGYPTLSAHPGGAPANYLAALTKYGAKTAMIGKVGGDAFGRQLVKTLSQLGIDTRAMKVDDGVFTTLAFVTLDENGEREFSFARKPGADTQLCTEELEFSVLDEARVLHFGTLSLTHEPARSATQEAVKYAKDCGKLISFDPNLRKPLWDKLTEARERMLWGLEQADVVKISDEEGEFLFGTEPEATADIIVEKYRARLVFVTCGEKGCIYRSAALKGASSPMKRLKAVDTTGAGDIFGGAAMSMLLKLGKAPESLSAEELKLTADFACAAAGLSVTRRGGITSIPEKEEVLNYLTEAGYGGLYSF